MSGGEEAAAVETTVRGVDPDGHRYEVVLNAPGSPVLMSPGLRVYLPEAGSFVMAAPVGLELVFSETDPVVVFAWLRRDTTVLEVEGPDLTPDLDGWDLVHPDTPEAEGAAEALGVDLSAVLYEDGVTEWVDEHDDVWVWDALEARYVRTAAGAKKYGLPIGSEIRRKNNRDGWHDDTARAKRRAYYARAKARAQARHAARMEREKQQRRELRAMKSAELRQAMLDAIAADDMRAFNRLAVESDRRDAARDTARAKRQHQREAEERRKAEEYEQLLTAGYDDEEAAEVVYGVPVERQRRQAAITSLRRSGYEGKNLEQLARAAFRTHVYEQFRKAEDDTNGYMVNPEGRRRNVDPLALFTGPEARARKWASPELREWWDLHGRPSFADYVDALVNGGALRRHRDDFHR